MALDGSARHDGPQHISSIRLRASGWLQAALATPPTPERAAGEAGHLHGCLDRFWVFASLSGNANRLPEAPRCRSGAQARPELGLLLLADFDTLRLHSRSFASHVWPENRFVSRVLPPNAGLGLRGPAAICMHCGSCSRHNPAVSRAMWLQLTAAATALLAHTLLQLKRKADQYRTLLSDAEVGPEARNALAAAAADLPPAAAAARPLLLACPAVPANDAPAEQLHPSCHAGGGQVRHGRAAGGAGRACQSRGEAAARALQG